MRVYWVCYKKQGQQRGPPGGPVTSCCTRGNKGVMVIDQWFPFSPQVKGQLEKCKLSIFYVHFLYVSITLSYLSEVLRSRTCFHMMSPLEWISFRYNLDTLLMANLGNSSHRKCCIRVLHALNTRVRGFKGIRSQYSFNTGQCITSRLWLTFYNNNKSDDNKKRNNLMILSLPESN